VAAARFSRQAENDLLNIAAYTLVRGKLCRLLLTISNTAELLAGNSALGVVATRFVRACAVWSVAVT
jgi:hypothetical protein